jgi:hypothetical protein
MFTGDALVSVGLRLWSLREIMRQFDAWGIAMLLHHIQEAKDFVQSVIDTGGRDRELEAQHIELFIRPVVTMAQHHAERVHLQSTHDRVWDNGPFRIGVAVRITYQECLHELKVLRECIEADLEKRAFVFILPEKAKLVREREANWKQVWEVIPKCKDDTKEALYCYALERNTAAVYHSMRVAEFGLRHIARKVGVRLIDKGKPQPIEFATWDKVIQGINTKITAARAMPHGPRKNKNLQFYSSAAENCTYIRDIWRNEISHTRKGDYNDGEALGVLNRVKDFMDLLAKGI